MTEQTTKRFLLLGHNFSPEPTGIGRYSGEMFDWLLKSGYNCTVVTTFPYYPYWKVQPPYKNRWYKKEVSFCAEKNSTLTVYRCPLYVPKAPTGKKRMIQDMLFWPSMFWVILKLMIFDKKHDYIVTVAPPFHLGYLAWLYKKLKGGKLIYHVQDLQIEAAHDLKMLSNEKFFDVLYAVERKILRGADFVSSISDGMIAKIGKKAGREILLFPNWADTSNLYPVEGRALLKEKWGFAITDLVCVYSGAIGEKQGLENVLLSAAELKAEPQIKFVICGSGPYKEKLVQMAESMNLANVLFLPLQDKAVFNDFLNMADIHLVIQKGDAADLVLPSKLTNILSVGGVSMVTASAQTSLYNLIIKYDVGFVLPPDEPKQFADMLLTLKQTDLSKQRANARAYALQYLDKDSIMNKFINDIS